jgi:Sulfotransferase family
MKFEDKTFVLGVGAQKAGTTWLHDYLSRRGDVYLPARKEMHYFNAKYRPSFYGRRKSHGLIEADRGRDPQSLKSDNAYKNFFRKRVPEELNVYGEITPAYAVIGEKGFREVRDLFPRCRVIFIMRDPVRRFYSQVRLFRDKCAEKNRPQPELEVLLEDPKFIERSRYDFTVRALDAVFEREQIIYLFYETLFRPETIQLLCEKLGLSYMPADLDHVVNGGGTVASAPSPIEERLVARLLPTYRFCRERFGGEVPGEWRYDGVSG